MWQRLGLFSSGNMLDPEFAIAVFDQHFKAAGEPRPGFTFLELGPGDSLASAVISCAYGAGRGWLIDSGAFASRDMAFYSKLIEKLGGVETRNTLPPDLGAKGLDELLARCHVEYLEGGLSSLTTIPSNSCDMVFSQAVLEHVLRKDFALVMSEIFRILKPGVVTSHDVDFQDHLGGSLNHLRFSNRIWETSCFAQSSGFYTNRILFSEMVAFFRGAGFEIAETYRDKWLKPPLPRRSLDRQFRNAATEDLRTWHGYFRLVKPASA